VYFSILGPLEVQDRDVHLSVRRGRPRNLLHLLIVNRRVVVPTEVLADRLWPDEPPQDVPNAVHQLLSYLRRALGPEGRNLLSTTPSGYVLNVPDDAVDAWLFDRHVAQALQLSSQPDAPALRDACAASDRAIKLWRGDPLPESSHLEWSAGVRARLHDGYVQAQLSRMDALLRLGRHREVVLDAHALAAAYPLREDFHHHHALALYRCGRPR
jgi:DNA-binding SARP family transcriptional activator